MRRSFHLAAVYGFFASQSRYRLPGTSGHAYHHHCFGAASRSQVAHALQVINAVPASSSSLATFKEAKT